MDRQRLGSLLTWSWIGIIVAFFTIGLAIHSVAMVWFALFGVSGLPLLFTSIRIGMRDAEKRRRLADKWSRWDREHPNPSEEYKEAIHSLRR